MYVFFEIKQLFLAFLNIPLQLFNLLIFLSHIQEIFMDSCVVSKLRVESCYQQIILFYHNRAVLVF